MLGELVIVEEKHLQFWKDYFHRSIDDLDFGRKVKMAVLVSVGRLFGETGIHLVLEAIEVHGIRKYLDLWNRSRGTDLEHGIRTILTDEFGHEDEIVSSYSNKQINPERIRSVFLGFNDGLVEILGAVSGFFAAFQEVRAVLIAGLTVAVAGAVSMAAGAFAATNSENEVLSIARGKQKFLGVRGDENESSDEHPLMTTIIVGASYFVGAAFPILPLLFGASTPIPSIIFAGIAIVLVSVILSFLSGMLMGKRILINVMTIVFAVGISSAIGSLVRMLWGVAV
jgi:VIT1/CCC1 family predicted Fe2+/Mn2+ transporter